MIELILKNYLGSKLNCPVLLEKPDDNTVEYVLLEKTGSSRSNHIDSATFAIQSYSGSLYEAATLNDSVKNALESIVYETEIASAKLNSDYNYTNTQTKEYRYQAVYEFTY